MAPSWLSPRYGNRDRPSTSPFGDIGWPGLSPRLDPILFCQPYNDTFAVLREEYGRAVDRLGTREVSTQRTADPEEHLNLAEHLATFYWWGRARLDDPSDPFVRFYASPEKPLRRHVVEFIGWNLGNTEGELEEEVRLLLVQLWTSRGGAEEGGRSDQPPRGPRACGIQRSSRRYVRRLRADHQISCEPGALVQCRHDAQEPAEVSASTQWAGPPLRGAPARSLRRPAGDRWNAVPRPLGGHEHLSPGHDA